MVEVASRWIDAVEGLEVFQQRTHAATICSYLSVSLTFYRVIDCPRSLNTRWRQWFLMRSVDCFLFCLTCQHLCVYYTYIVLWWHTILHNMCLKSLRTVNKADVQWIDALDQCYCLWHILNIWWRDFVRNVGHVTTSSSACGYGRQSSASLVSGHDHRLTIWTLFNDAKMFAINSVNSIQLIPTTGGKEDQVWLTMEAYYRLSLHLFFAYKCKEQMLLQSSVSSMITTCSFLFWCC